MNSDQFQCLVPKSVLSFELLKSMLATSTLYSSFSIEDKNITFVSVKYFNQSSVPVTAANEFYIVVYSSQAIVKLPIDYFVDFDSNTFTPTNTNNLVYLPVSDIIIQDFLNRCSYTVLLFSLN